MIKSSVSMLVLFFLFEDFFKRPCGSKSKKENLLLNLLLKTERFIRFPFKLCFASIPIGGQAFLSTALHVLSKA